MDDGFSAEDWLRDDNELSRRFVVYLPSKKKSGDLILEVEELADGIARMLRERFGGATRYPAIGYFGDQEEEVFVIECYCGEDAWRSSSNDLYSVMRALGHYLQQDSIACSFDGKMALVKPAPAGNEEFDLAEILHLPNRPAATGE